MLKSNRNWTPAIPVAFLVATTIRLKVRVHHSVMSDLVATKNEEVQSCKRIAMGKITKTAVFKGYSQVFLPWQV